MASGNDGDIAAAAVSSVLPLLFRMAAMAAPAVGEGVVLVQHVILSGAGDGDLARGVPPASKAAIAALKEVESAAGAAGGGEEAAVGDCAICLDGVVVGGKEMPCGHRFHGECVEKWLRIHGNCPVCRYELPVADEEEGAKRAGGTALVVSYMVGGGGDGEERREEVTGSLAMDDLD